MKITFLSLFALLMLSLVTLSLTPRQEASARSGQEVAQPEFGTIEGVVRDLHGNPIPEADVYCYVENRRVRTTADEHGRFILRNLPPRSLSVHAYKDSAGYPDSFFAFFGTNPRAWQRVDVQAGRTTGNVVIELGPVYATLRLTILDENGMPINAGLYFSRTDDPRRDYSTSATSTSVRLVPPVPFRLKIEAEGYEDWHYTSGTGRNRTDLIVPRSGETISITARLRRSH